MRKIVAQYYIIATGAERDTDTIPGRNRDSVEIRYGEGVPPPAPNPYSLRNVSLYSIPVMTSQSSRPGGSSVQWKLERRERRERLAHEDHERGATAPRAAPRAPPPAPFPGRVQARHRLAQRRRALAREHRVRYLGGPPAPVAAIRHRPQSTCGNARTRVRNSLERRTRATMSGTARAIGSPGRRGAGACSAPTPRAPRTEVRATRARQPQSGSTVGRTARHNSVRHRAQLRAR